jgi:quinol monooxygenase YgiN
MALVSFITKIKAKPGKGAALEALNREMCGVSEGEPGTLVYCMSRSSEDVEEFWYFDVYADQAAFELHCASPTYKKMIAEIGDYAEEMEATRLEPFVAKGLDTQR